MFKIREKYRSNAQWAPISTEDLIRRVVDDHSCEPSDDYLRDLENKVNKLIEFNAGLVEA